MYLLVTADRIAGTGATDTTQWPATRYMVDIIKNDLGQFG